MSNRDEIALRVFCHYNSADCISTLSAKVFTVVLFMIFQETYMLAVGVFRWITILPSSPSCTKSNNATVPKVAIATVPTSVFVW